MPLQKDKIRLLLNLLNADNDEMVEAIWMGILREFIACVENVGEDEVIQEAVSGVGELARRVGFGVTTKGSGAAGPVREDVVKVCVTALMEMIGSPYGMTPPLIAQIRILTSGKTSLYRAPSRFSNNSFNSNCRHQHLDFTCSNSKLPSQSSPVSPNSSKTLSMRKHEPVSFGSLGNMRRLSRARRRLPSKA